MQEPKADREWTELTPVIASSCILFAFGIAFFNLLFDLTYIWENFFLWWTSPHISISHPPWAARTWSSSHLTTWMGTEGDQDVQPTALRARGRFCSGKPGKGIWHLWLNTEIQGRLWHLDVERLTRNFISAKKRSLHRGLAQIPKILRCLIPEDINSNQMVKCSANYVKEAERNYFSSLVGIAHAILWKSPQRG